MVSLPNAIINRFQAWLKILAFGLLGPMSEEIIERRMRLLGISDLIFGQLNVRNARLKRFND